MLFKPKWLRLLPPHLEPNSEQIDKLDKLRVEHGIPHEALAMRISSSKVTTRRVQKYCLELCRTRNPNASEKELFEMVLNSRLQSPPANLGILGVEIDQMMKKINSFDDLCDVVIALDEEEPSFPDPFGIGEQIDIMLSESGYGEY